MRCLSLCAVLLSLTTSLLSRDLFCAREETNEEEGVCVGGGGGGVGGGCQAETNEGPERVK